MASKTSRKGRTLAKKSEYTSQLDLFTREFHDEARLRTVVADLLRKMGNNGVRITHGSSEKGKDIVFYNDGPLGERRLFACVVKNQPITGQAEDQRNGAPTLVSQLQGVLNQIESAFSEPLADGKGKDEWVDSVYVISPHECTTNTIDSVKNRLQRSGQITFICGSLLMELFAKHWKEFLWFESSILVSYLSALRKGLDEDYALANVILANPYLGNSPASWSDLYVQPRFHRELRPLELTESFALDLAILRGPKRLADVNALMRSARDIDELLATARLWADDPTATIGVGTDVVRLANEILELWRIRYREYVRMLRTNAREKRPRTAQGFSASGAFVDSDNMVPAEKDISVELLPTKEVVSYAEVLRRSVEGSVDLLKGNLSSASSFASTSKNDSLNALGSPAFMNYCRMAEVATIVPQGFEQTSISQNLLFEENLLDEFSASLLITGPAGFGKTTFCRWHAIRDAGSLVQKKASVLPVYRALHSLSQGKLGSCEDVFFPEEELGKLLKQQAAGQSPFSRIRLYLDGLDEIPSAGRQQEVVILAEKATTQWNFIQVIFTARNHVNSAALRWLPRIRLSGLSDEKIQVLAGRWLEKGDLTLFLERLNDSGGIAALMRIPLLATLILAVFRKTKSIPPNKTKLYTLFVELLCGGWDFYKHIQRRASRFGVRDKEVVLARLAGMLQHQNKRDATASDFRSAIKNSISSVSPDWEQLMQDIIEDGLLVRTGGMLTFSHLSFQEFLASRDLRDHMGTRPKQTLSWYLNGDDWWREVLAFYVTLLDRPGEADEWMIKRAIASTAIVPDLEDRVRYLRQALQAAFPAYKPTAGTEVLYEDLIRKARRYGKGETDIDLGKQ
jgi:hypothetical protein